MRHTAAMRSIFVYHVDDRLSAAELSAARLDGHVVELGDAFIPADAVETAALRAASLHRIVGDDLAASHLTAAWIHGALDDPPPRHTVQRAAARRLHHVIGRRFVYRDPVVPAEDLVRMGGVQVTTPARTLADLARQSGDDELRAARTMAARLPAVVAEALRWFASAGRLPRKRAAIALLESCAAGAVRTR